MRCQNSALKREINLKYPNIASAIKVGKRQTIETLINEEALLLAKNLRDEKKEWYPRVGLQIKEGRGVIESSLFFSY